MSFITPQNALAEGVLRRILFPARHFQKIMRDQVLRIGNYFVALVKPCHNIISDKV